jgi:ABC-type dipeptide/oligopeptide/nickel transport system permease component
VSRLLFRRLLSIVPTMLAASALIFGLLRVVPGDPVDALAMEGGISPERAALLRQELGLTLPLPLQYVHWLGSALTGDLGVSLWSDFRVGWLIWQALPRTALLAAGAIAIGLLVGVPLAFAAATWPRSPFATIATALSTVSVAVPGFALAIGGLLVFAVWLRWVPATQSVILPAVILGLDFAGTLIRFLRADLETQLGSDYVRMAIAKGQSSHRILAKHVARNALITGITVLGLAFGNLLTGATIIETIFDWPGVGLLAIDAIRARDYPIVQGTVLLIAFVFALVNVLADVLYAAADPRVRLD